MASLAAVQASVDLALECALRDIVQKAASLLSEGRRVSDADIATLCLDETFFDLTQNIMAVLDDLEWATGEGFEADDALRLRAEVQVDVALGVAEQEAWETLKDLFDQHVLAPPAATLERLSGVFVLLRTRVATVVEAADTPRSTPNDSEEDADEAIETVDIYRAAGFTGPVYLMPVGGVESVYTLNNRRVAELAMKAGLRYSDRLQVPLFKNEWGT